jgi:hypothetical protein
MWLAAALLSLTAAGCGSDPASHSGAGRVDFTRIATLQHDFPPGFSTHAFDVQQEEARFVDQVGTTVSYGKSFTVDPPQCHALLKPVDGKVGADYTGVRADGPGSVEQTIFVGADDQVTVPQPIPAAGCDRMAFEVDSAIPDGTAVRLPAPRIPNATTAAFKVSYDTQAAPEYYYFAILDGNVYVHVDARVSESFQAEPFLPNLLVKAVAAVRGK